MKRIGAFILSICCALAFAGCAPAIDDSIYVGQWELVSGSGDNLDVESIDFAKELGATVTLDLADDGTGTLDLYGEASDLEWEATDEDSATLVVDGAGESTMSVSDDTLTVEDDAGQTLSFSRI